MIDCAWCDERYAGPLCEECKAELALDEYVRADPWPYADGSDFDDMEVMDDAERE